MCKKTARVVLRVQSSAAVEVSPAAKLAPNKKQLAKQAAFCLERLRGVEPPYAAWEAAVLPMNYSRVCMV